jgi:hypothetical protein
LTDDALKLRAQDAEDLEVLSSCLQDALVRLGDMTYLADERRFVLVANRFKWEAMDEAELLAESAPLEPEGDADFHDPSPTYQRVNCGLCFDAVRRVRTRQLDLRNRGQILSLMAIMTEPGAVTLCFAHGGAVRLEVDRLLCHAQDLDEPWPTKWRPQHSLDDSAERSGAKRPGTAGKAASG